MGMKPNFGEPAEKARLTILVLIFSSYEILVVQAYSPGGQLATVVCALLFLRAVAKG